MAQHFVQTGLSSGMSATSGFHRSPVNPVPPETGVPLGQKSLQPEGWTPSAETKFIHKAKGGDVLTAPISIGAWPWGDTATFHWKPEDRPNVDALWEICRRAGLTFIDTAQFYGSGDSERIIGEITKGIPRNEFVLQTKYYVVPSVQNLLHPTNSPLLKLKESCERMQVDYVDIYLVHGPIHAQSISTIAKGMAKCVEEGLAKAIGVANYSKDDMIKIQAELAKYDIPLACNQVEYHPIRRIPELDGLLEECKKRGIVMQSYSSLAQGKLGGKYNKNNPPPKSYVFSDFPMEDLEPILEVLRAIATKRNVPVSAVTLNYNLSKGVLPVVGIRTAEQAEQNAQALGWRLTAEEIAAIDEKSLEGYTTKLWQQG